MGPVRPADGCHLPPQHAHLAQPQQVGPEECAEVGDCHVDGQCQAAQLVAVKAYVRRLLQGRDGLLQLLLLLLLLPLGVGRRQ